MTPTDRTYTKHHTWVLLKEDMATIGITEYLQSRSDKILYITLPLLVLPSMKQIYQQGHWYGLIIYATSAPVKIFAPISGRVIQINETVQNCPNQANDDPYGAGWLLRMQVEGYSRPRAFMNAAAYDNYLKKLEGNRGKRIR